MSHRGRHDYLFLFLIPLQSFESAVLQRQTRTQREDCVLFRRRAGLNKKEEQP